MGVTLFAIIVVILAGCVGYLAEGRWRDAGDFTIGALLGIIPALILSLVVAASVSTEYQKTGEIEISALKDGSQTSGSFFLGSGTVDEEQYYFFVKDTEKGKKIDKISADNAYINETDDVNPHIEVYTDMPTTSFGKFMLTEGLGADEYRIYVPKGSVTNEFNVDLE